MSLSRWDTPWRTTSIIPSWPLCPWQGKATLRIVEPLQGFQALRNSVLRFETQKNSDFVNRSGSHLPRNETYRGVNPRLQMQASLEFVWGPRQRAPIQSISPPFQFIYVCVITELGHDLGPWLLLRSSMRSFSDESIIWNGCHCNVKQMNKTATEDSRKEGEPAGNTAYI